MTRLIPALTAILSSLLIPCLLLSGCSDEEQKDITIRKKEPEDQTDLKALMSRLRNAVLEDDDETAIPIAKRLFPTQETLALSCVSSGHSASYQSVSKWLEQVKPRKPKDYLRNFPFKSWQTEIVISSMSGEELKEATADTRKKSGFHKEAFRLARSGFLKASTQFHSVEFRKPGDLLGRRFELFVYDPQKKAWKMLGPIWRILKSPQQQLKR